MEGTEEALLIILSGALAVFLILGIIALRKTIEVLNHLNVIAAKAESIANKADNLADFFRYSAGPAALGKFITSISDVVFRHGNKAKKGKDDD